MMRFLVIILTAILINFPQFIWQANSQEIIISQVKTDKGNIIINYDLLDENADRRYTLRLYVSLDNYIQPVELVEGDIGADVVVGGNKTLIWKAKEELGSDFKGEVGIELKGQQFIPFINLVGFEDYKSFKRTKPYPVTWTGGRADNVLNFDLIKGEEKVYTIPSVGNTGSHEMVIPVDVKPGNDYHFKISDLKNQDEIIYTNTFAIKRKTPLGIKVAAGVVTAGIIYFVYAALQPTEGPESIPDPPIP